MRRALDRVVGGVTERSKLTIAVMLVLTVAVGTGATSLAGPSGEQLGGDSTAQEKLDYIRANYETGPTNVTAVQVFVRDRGGNVLSQEALVASLRFQRDVVTDDAVAGVLLDRRGVANAVATRLAAGEGQGQGEDPGLDAQITALVDAEDARVRGAVREVLAANSPLLGLMPASYQPGTPTAEARQVLFTLRGERENQLATTGPVAEAEQAIYDRIRARSGDGVEYFTLSGPALREANAEAQTDTLELIGPLAMLFILVALAFAYRDVADVVVGMVGVVLTLVWMFGFIGWLQVPFGSAAIIAPILLIGLSIDYGIHVFMRHREERDGDEGIRPPMRRALLGVGAALVLVTVTTAIGFLSNLTSPLSEIRSLAVATSLGVVAALVVFVTVVPALKIEVDGLLERVGFDRRKRALGTGGGRVGRFLTGGVTAARASAVGVVLVAVLLGGAGAVAWTDLDRSLSDRPEQPAEWQQDLPEPFGMHEYEFLDQFAYVQDNFQRSGPDVDPAQVLVEGAVTDADTLHGIDAATADLAESDVVFRRGDGSVAITTPVTVMETVAASDESFAATFSEADTDDDGVPERNVAGVYDALFAAAPDRAASVVERVEAGGSDGNGQYRSVRLVVPARQSAAFDDVTRTVRDAAATIEGESAGTGGDVTATATGSDVIVAVQLEILTENVLVTLVVSLVAVFVLLMVVYRLAEGSATLGAVTVLPIALVVTWVFGAMYLLEVPLTLFTALMMSLAIGLGIDYAIHLSERFAQELPGAATAEDALETAVRGTGGALLGSTTTTVGAFSTLALSTFPTVEQLGTMVALALVFSFVASVFVLPSLLVLWARHVEWESIVADRGARDGEGTRDGEATTD